MPSDPRRKYYDHEPAYRVRSDRGFSGWSDSPDDGAYDRFNEFLASGRMTNPGLMLDTGCGGGELCIQLSEQGWKTFGIDFSETALQLALQNARESDASTRFSCADLTETWPVEEKTFDLVVDNHVLHCLTNPAHRSAYLTNAHRVLKPGGVMFSANMSREGELDFERMGIDRTTGIDEKNTRIWVSEERLLSEFNEAGFTVRRYRNYTCEHLPKAGDEFVIEAMKNVST